MAGGPFRQQCPSCEALILIKDPKQIGKKADCPKCKYRFVIERPAEAATEVEVVEDAPADAVQAKGPADPQTARRPAVPADDPKKEPAPTVKKKTRPKARDDEDDDVGFKAKKKDSSGNMVLILGIGLAVLALGLLVAGGWFIFMTSDSGAGPITRIGGPTTGPSKTTEPEDDPTAKGPKFAELTNLLPNDTQGVYHFHARNLMRSLIGMASLETAGAFQRRPVEDKLGINFDEVDEFIIAHNLRNGWLFTAVRTNKPVNLKLLQDKLRLQPAEAIKKQPYYVTEPSPWLDNLARLFLEVNLGVTAAAPAAPRQRSLAVRVVDEQTFVIGDLEPVKAFLEADGKPKEIAKADSRPPGNAPRPTTKWLTVSQPLKNVLDRIEPKTPFIGSVAWDLGGFRDALQGAVNILIKAQLADAKTATLVDETQAVGISLQIRDTSTFTLAVDARNAQVGAEIQKELRNVGQQLSQQRNSTFDIDGFLMVPPPPRVAPGMPPLVRNPGPKYLVRSNLGSNVPMFTMEVQLPPPEGNQMVLRGFLRPQMIVLRGLAEMATGQPRLFELAAAMQAYVKKHNAFPRGTLDRKGANFGRPFPPDQRISWMAELLPFLGYDDVFRQLNAERSWRPETDPVHRMKRIDDNARAGSALIPAFLDPATPPPTWWVTMPSAPGYHFGATHFVGVAGVGLDAAEYAPDDALTAKKLGIFGYNRVTRPEDVKDGLPNTILLLQVPPTFKRPWIAGGGATVAGIPETKCIAPFVSTQRDGKKGTYALMADGTIRFLGDDISDENFKALVTINGGEKVELDKIAPLLPPPEAKK